MKDASIDNIENAARASGQAIRDVLLEMLESSSKNNAITSDGKTREQQRDTVLQNNLINVSGDANNCGLFALTLGVKRALDRDGAKVVSLTEEFSTFVYQCEEIDFTEITSNTRNIGRQLRQYIFEALRQDEIFKIGRYQNFLPIAINYVTNEALPPDMEAFQHSNQAFLERIRHEWQALSQYLVGFYENFGDYMNRYHISEEAVIDCLFNMRQVIVDNTRNHDEEAQRFFDEYKGNHDDFFPLKALYQKAWARVKEEDASPEVRQLFNDSMAKCFRTEMVEKLVAIPDVEVDRKVREACRMGFLEGVKFEEQVIQASLETMRENARSLLIESLVMPTWPEIYQKYLNYVREEPVYLSVDELGCLAKYWNVQLQINFQDAARPPHRSYSESNHSLLNVVLCNPSQGHWMVDETDSLLEGQSVDDIDEAKEPLQTPVAEVMRTTTNVLGVPPVSPTMLSAFTSRQHTLSPRNAGLGRRVQDEKCAKFGT